MSTETEKLGLFKYDPDTDGASTFNIRQALNENWDKIDQNAKQVSSALSETAQTLEELTPDKIGAASNPNLLDNWYFADPVNQRGQTTYTGEGYTIDRWRSRGATTSIGDGVVTLLFPNAWSGDWYQTFENVLPAGEYTFSCIVSGSNAGAFSVILKNEAGDWSGSASVGGTSGLQSATITTTDSSKMICIVSSAANVSVSLAAVKLERGLKQTLAHQGADGNWVLNDPPPNKSLELAKCQRYCMVYGSEPRQGQVFMPYGTYNAGGYYFDFVFPCPNFRAVPVIETWTGFSLFDGQSVYGIKTMSVVGYSAGMVHIGVSPADGSRAFSNGEQAAIFSERETFVLHANL